MEAKEYIKQEVHRLYWEHDTNCARTTMHCLGGLLNTEIEEQTWNAAVGMFGAGGYRAQCGLVEGSLLFIGIYCYNREIPKEKSISLCKQFASEFEGKFGSLRCRELRPGGFNEEDPPHLCEKMTCEAIEFTYNFIQKNILEE